MLQGRRLISRLGTRSSEPQLLGGRTATRSSLPRTAGWRECSVRAQCARNSNWAGGGKQARKRGQCLPFLSIACKGGQAGGVCRLPLPAIVNAQLPSEHITHAPARKPSSVCSWHPRRACPRCDIAESHPPWPHARGAPARSSAETPGSPASPQSPLHSRPGSIRIRIMGCAGSKPGERGRERLGHVRASAAPRADPHPAPRWHESTCSIAAAYPAAPAGPARSQPG